MIWHWPQIVVCTFLALLAGPLVLYGIHYDMTWKAGQETPPTSRGTIASTVIVWAIVALLAFCLDRGGFWTGGVAP